MQKTPQQIKEERKIQANQIFNIAEQHVMNFIAQFLEETPNAIFKDPLPTYVEPLILLPFDEYKEDVCIKFTIKPIILNENDTPPALTIDSIIEHKKVKEGIGFLWHCIKEVFNAIISSSMINSKPMDNISMVLDEENWAFCPRYSHDLTIKKGFLEDALGKLMYIKKNIHKFPEEMANEITQEFPKVVNQLKDLNKQLTPEIREEEKRINDSYIGKTVLGIFVEEILKKDLPKPIISQADEQNEKNNEANTESNEEPYDVEQNVNNLFISSNEK